ncbi:hypothetical protein ACI789_01545 [Geodermatophilus sp. SYSU D00965]
MIPLDVARTRPAPPLARAHASGTGARRSLGDALHSGCTSVEVGVRLVDGELRVDCDRAGTRPGVTLPALYLDPLAARVAALGGSVHRGWTRSLQLLVDVRSEGRSTHAALEGLLRRSPRLVTHWTGGTVRRRPVTVVVSGNRPPVALAAARLRFCALEGRPADLGTGFPPSLVPVVSDDWNARFTWTGVGPMPATEREDLRALVTAAHARGHRLRFRATPESSAAAREAVWGELLAAGVDHIGSDDPGALQAFLRRADAVVDEHVA